MPFLVTLFNWMYVKIPASVITPASSSSLASVITCAVGGDKHPKHQMTFSDFTVFNWILWIKQFVISLLGVFVTLGEDTAV